MQKPTATLITTWVIAMLAIGSAAAADVVATHNDWKVYRHTAAGELMCFAVSQPTEEGDGERERQKPHVYVTAWPKAGIKAEISVLVGYELRRGTEIKVEIGGATFTMLADGDRAYVGDANEELRLLEAMRRGRTMTVLVPDGGDGLKDVYSLSGVTASVQEIAASCR